MDLLQAAVAKFGSFEAFEAAHAERPVTTQISFGYLPSDEERARLCIEWKKEIKRWAQTYGGRGLNKHRKLREDLLQEANICLLEEAAVFEPKDGPWRFDVVARSRIRDCMMRFLKKNYDAREVPADVHGNDDGSTPIIVSELATDDQADYAMATGPAHRMIHRLLNGDLLPETYRRILNARIYAEGDCVSYLLAEHDVWSCPHTGKEVRLSDKTLSNRTRWMERRYDEAFSLVHHILVAEKGAQILKRWLQLEADMQRPGFRRTLVLAPGKSVLYGEQHAIAA